jgi:metal-sulfur cluster biosynthetic enzyme
VFVQFSKKKPIMSRELVNAAPTIYSGARDDVTRGADDARRAQAEDEADPIDGLEVYGLLRDIKDPEHPNTLEELRVVNPEHIAVDESRRRVTVQFTPTVPHCSMTTLIGLCILVKLRRCMPQNYRFSVRVSPGSHEQEEQVNKQLGDKERVAAALENSALVQAVASCLRPPLVRV